MADGAGAEAKPTFMHPSIFKVIEQKKRIKDLLAPIRHKVGIYSAKGGVGKTTTAVNLAYALSSLGKRVGLLDADVDCPNISLFLGLDSRISGEYPLIPVEKDGIKVMSTAMFLDDEKMPIIWRGPMIGKMISEFLENTAWGDLDYLVLDLPPGTSDAPLSIIQLLELDGFVLVTTPQRISAVNTIRSGMMARRLGAALLGVVENMSNGEALSGRHVASELGCEFLGSVKENKEMQRLSDEGIVPFGADPEIKEEYISIARKIIR